MERDLDRYLIADHTYGAHCRARARCAELARPNCQPCLREGIAIRMLDRVIVIVIVIVEFVRNHSKSQIKRLARGRLGPDIELLRVGILAPVVRLNDALDR